MTPYKALIITRSKSLYLFLMTMLEPATETIEAERRTLRPYVSKTAEDQGVFFYVYLVPDLCDRTRFELREFTDEAELDLVFEADVRLEPCSQTAGTLFLPLKKYWVWSREVVEAECDFRVQTQNYGHSFAEKCTSHLVSEDWERSFLDLGNNRSPKGEMSDMLFYRDSVDVFIEDIKAETGVDIAENTIEEVHFYARDLKRCAHVVRSYYADTENELERADQFQRSSGLIWSFIETLVHLDSQLIKAEVGAGAAGQVLRRGKMRFGTNNKTVSERLLQKEAKGIWGQIRNYLVDAILDGLRSSSGSLVMEFQTTNRDAAILSSLCRSTVLDVVLPEDNALLDFDFDVDYRSLPAYLCEFLDELEQLGDPGLRDRGHQISWMYARWMHHDVVGPIIERLYKNPDLSMDASMCG